MSEQDTSTTELIFEEPPPPADRGGRPVGSSPFGRWLISLREHPDRWAKYPEPVNSRRVSAVRKGKNYGVKPGEFEVAIRNTDRKTGRGDLYARYVGEESAS